jgi:hypothetical protein
MIGVNRPSCEKAKISRLPVAYQYQKQVGLFTWGESGELLHRWDENEKRPQLLCERGFLITTPVAAIWTTGLVEIFAMGVDTALWHGCFEQRRRWLGWNSLGGFLSAPPRVISSQPGRLDIFVWGADQYVWHRWVESNLWSPWKMLDLVELFQSSEASRAFKCEVAIER